jgi:hypothetical protein
MMRKHTPEATFSFEDGRWTVSVGTVSRTGEDLEVVLQEVTDAFLFIQAPVTPVPKVDEVEAVLAKVKALLAKAESTDSVDEAASCARLAQELLFKHRLDTADLAEHDDPIENQVVPLKPRPFVDTWRLRLVCRVARMNGCQGYVNTHRQHQVLFTEKEVRYHVVGKRSDLSLTQYILVYLLFQIEVLCRTWARGKGRTWANNFRLGAVDAITDKMKAAVRQAKKEAKKTTTGTTALVKLDHREVVVEEWIVNNLDLGTHKDPEVKRDEKAWLEGYHAGKTVEVPKAP